MFGIKVNYTHPVLDVRDLSVPVGSPSSEQLRCGTTKTSRPSLKVTTKNGTLMPRI